MEPRKHFGEHKVLHRPEIRQASIDNAAMEGRPHPLVESQFGINHIGARPQLHIMDHSARFSIAQPVQSFEHSQTVHADHRPEAESD